MSKYTIELGIALENILNQREKNVDNYVDIVDKSAKLIMCRQYPDYIGELIKKMVQVKYYDELCTYPWGKWKIMFDGELTKNLSRYDSIYNEISKNLNLFDNINYSVSDIFDGHINQVVLNNTNSDSSSDTTDTSTNALTSNTTNHDESDTSSTNNDSSVSEYNDLNKMLDTPQSKVQNLSDGYLTSVSSNEKNTEDTRNSTNVSSITGDSTSENTTNNTINSSNNFVGNNEIESNTNDTKTTADSRNQKHTGKNSGENYLDLLSQINDKVVSLTEIFIDDMGVMFFGLL